MDINYNFLKLASIPPLIASEVQLLMDVNYNFLKVALPSHPNSL